MNRGCGSINEIITIENIVNDNTFIDVNLKDKLIECIKMIINTFPDAYNNLKERLKTLITRYETNFNDTKYEADSYYDNYKNILILNRKVIKSQYYKNILVHQLLHIASSKKNNIGFKDLVNNIGTSLNEGMTEYLTRFILKDMSFGFESYKTDINNILLLSSIISLDELYSIYFNKSLIDVIRIYIDRIGKNNSLISIISNMDMDYIKRQSLEENIEYKNKYISNLLIDISKMHVKDEVTAIKLIKGINSFIKFEYDIVPREITSVLNLTKETLIKKAKYNDLKIEVI